MKTLESNLMTARDQTTSLNKGIAKVQDELD